MLSSTEAICLFSRYAFQKEIPIQGHEELSGKVVRYAAGLPLTIKLLGSSLCGKDKLEWVDAIERLKKIPLKDTLEKLELSYISLEDEYKEIFLDIACILKGQHKEKAIRILESCGFHARNGLKVLEQRSLITVDKYGILGMHDHIEEMEVLLFIRVFGRSADGLHVCLAEVLMVIQVFGRSVDGSSSVMVRRRNTMLMLILCIKKLNVHIFLVGGHRCFLQLSSRLATMEVSAKYVYHRVSRLTSLYSSTLEYISPL
ncbi:Toll/interleukin-1 receptor domain-containing protein [Tanacetum coccineum]